MFERQMWRFMFCTKLTRKLYEWMSCKIHVFSMIKVSIRWRPRRRSRNVSKKGDGQIGGLKWKLWENCHFIHVQNVHKHKYKWMNKFCNCFSLFFILFSSAFGLFYYIFICFLNFKAGMLLAYSHQWDPKKVKMLKLGALNLHI